MVESSLQLWQYYRSAIFGTCSCRLQSHFKIHAGRPILRYPDFQRSIGDKDISTGTTAFRRAVARSEDQCSPPQRVLAAVVYGTLDSMLQNKSTIATFHYPPLPVLCSIKCENSSTFYGSPLWQSKPSRRISLNEGTEDFALDRRHGFQCRQKKWYNLAG